MESHGVFRSLCLAAASVIGVNAIAPDAGAALPAYSLVGSFELPTGATVWDTAPDGRVITLVGGDVYRQDAPASSSFTRLGSLAAGEIPSFGAAFLRISPDGSTLAIGDNYAGGTPDVLLVPTLALNPLAPTTPTRLALDHSEADWAGNSTLFVTGSTIDGSFVAMVDVPTLTSRHVVGNINGAAAGVTSDGKYLYAGNGFAFGGPSQTGEVRAFPLSAITASATPLDFEIAGIPVADALTGSSLGFDGFGNLLVGGGDFFGGSGDLGSAAVIDADAVAAALSGAGVAPDSAELRLSPRLPTDSYFSRWSDASGELLVGSFDNTTFTSGTTIYRYAVPSPGVNAMVMLAGLGLSVRRRRSADASEGM